eukprot:8786509-Alexandrium_andersonii.AAC.1
MEVTKAHRTPLGADTCCVLGPVRARTHLVHYKALIGLKSATTVVAHVHNGIAFLRDGIPPSWLDGCRDCVHGTGSAVVRLGCTSYDALPRMGVTRHELEPGDGIERRWGKGVKLGGAHLE